MISSQPKYGLCVLIITVAMSAACKDGDSGYYRPPPDIAKVSYGERENQWMNFYLADSDTPTPVYIFSHANGSTADDVSRFVDDLKEVGISTVSWESVVMPNGSSEDLETGWNDAELMLAWLKDNKETYNLDTDNVIMGGRSRGSVFSWRLAHSQDPVIKGIYMFQALPDGVWENPESWTPTLEVTENSPPLKFTYREEPGTDDGHKPEHGYTILDRYEELGIGDQTDLSHSLDSQGKTLYYDIADWCLDILDL